MNSVITVVSKTCCCPVCGTREFRVDGSDGYTTCSGEEYTAGYISGPFTKGVIEGWLGYVTRLPLCSQKPKKKKPLRFI